ncbi:MAG: nitroreductase [Lewinellaceae bacterium]|nr:nitroreductase [Lewinellaceae bacterium]
MLSPSSLRELIRQRRAIFPATYTDQPVAKEIVEEILENANWAPTHRLTEPWRFKVFNGAARQRLADYLAEQYRLATPPEQFSEVKYRKTQQNPLRAAYVIAICMQRDPQEQVPEWEEIAAVSCAVQNMWLTCTAYGLGSYWSTPATILQADDFLELGPGERCLGLFYLGHHQSPALPGKRHSIAEKTRWLDQ